MDPGRTSLFPNSKCPVCGADFVDGAVSPVADQVMKCLNGILFSGNCEMQKRLVERATRKVSR